MPTIISGHPGERRDGSGTNLGIRFSKPINPVSLLAPNQVELSRDATTLTISIGSVAFGLMCSINFSKSPAAFDWTGNRAHRLPVSGLRDEFSNAQTKPVTMDFQTASLPAASSVTLSLRGITDLSGNPLPEQTFTYFTLSPDEDVSLPRLISSLPQPPQNLIATNPIMLQFSQPMEQNSLRLALAVNHGNQVLDFSLATTDNGRTWTLTPSAPWPIGGGLRLLLASTAYSQAGILLTNPTERSFVVVATAAPNSSLEGSASASLAAYFATGRVIDLLFDRPLAETPAEPFGVRLGHQRVPGVTRRMSERWLQIQLDDPMQDNAPYHLMLGPSLEIPFSPSPEPPLAQQPEEPLPSGSRRWRLDRPNHRFALASLACPNSPELLVPPQSSHTSSLTILNPVTESQLECDLPAPTSQVGKQTIRLNRK